MKKRLISFFTSLLMMFSVISVMPLGVQAATISEETFAAKIAELKTIYRDGEYWNYYNDCGVEGTGLKKCYCTYSCPWYCSCKCGKFYYNDSYVGGQCFGFANKMAYLIFGSVPERHWEYYSSVSNYYAGDYVRVRDDAHSIFITKVEGNTVTYVDCNNAGPCKVKWDRTITVSSLKSMTTYVRHLEGNTLKGTGIFIPDPDPIITVDWTVDSSYPTPISAYPAATSGKINVYNLNLTAYAHSERHIAYNDLCTINTVYKNGYCSVTYPTSSGTNTEFAKLSDFIPNAVTKYSYSPSVNVTSYTRSSLSETFGSVFTTDKCTVVGKSGNKLQLIYPVSGGYKLGWINAETVAPSQLATPLYGYNASPTVRTTVYESLSTMGTYYGQIFVDDACTLNSVNFTDNWINVTYPANGSTKTGYVYLSEFIPTESRISSFYKTTVTAQSTSYRKSDMGTSYGYVSAGDEITVIGKSGNKLQVVYPLDAGGYKLAWIYDTYVKKELSNISIASNPTKTTYLEGESLNTSGLYVIATYNDGSTANVTSSCTLSGYSSTPGVKTVTVTYSGKTTAFTVNVNNKSLTAVSLTATPSKKDYYIGDSVSLSGLAVKATYNNGTSATVTNYNTSIDSTTTASAGTKTIYVYYDYNNVEKKATFNINVTKPTITLSKGSLSMKKGETTTLTASSTPSSQSISWTSSDTSVVSVSDGKITANGSGNATISAYYTYNGTKYEAKASVSVVAETTVTTTIKTTTTTTSKTTTTTTKATTTVTTKTTTTTLKATTTIPVTTKVTTTTIVKNDTDALIKVIGESGYPGDTVYAEIYMSKNPGVIAMCLDIEYDKNILELVSATDGKILGESTATFGYDLSSVPYRLCWDDAGTVNNTGNGILATLEFKILENASPEETEIYVSVDKESTFDVDFNNVAFNTQSGIVFVKEKVVTTTAVTTIVPVITTATTTTKFVTTTTIPVTTAKTTTIKSSSDVDAMIKVIGESGYPGENVYAEIYVSKNPGIVAMCLDVEYDKNILELVSVTDGKILGDSTSTFGYDLSAVPYRLCWDDAGTVNNTGNGVLATLEFKILESAGAEETEIYVSVDEESTFDVDFNNVVFNVQPGIVFVKEKVVTTTAVTTTVPVTSTTTTATITTTPIITTTEPVTTTQIITTTVPVTTTPIITMTEPVTTTQIITTTEPVTTTPIITTTEPVTTTTIIITTEPVTTTTIITTTEAVTTTTIITTTEAVTTTTIIITTELATTTIVTTTTENVTSEDFGIFDVIEKNGELIIINCDSSAVNVVVPYEINGKPVVKINDYALSGENIKTVIFENPDIEIADSESTINEDAVIYGHWKSEAHDYALEYDREFESLDIVLDYLKGDVNGDNIINIYDAIEIAKYIMDMRTLTDEEFVRADYDSNDIVNLYDAIGVARELLPKSK